MPPAQDFSKVGLVYITVLGLANQAVSHTESWRPLATAVNYLVRIAPILYMAFQAQPASPVGVQPGSGMGGDTLGSCSEVYPGIPPPPTLWWAMVASTLAYHCPAGCTWHLSRPHQLQQIYPEPDLACASQLAAPLKGLGCCWGRCTGRGMRLLLPLWQGWWQGLYGLCLLTLAPKGLILDRPGASTQQASRDWLVGF
ncbi:hypothetical protein DSO57_1007331 [Entomophthora muscae]|uniref:Uncharacterized protein n=1 Tax=Entomophthora muscae TaxID=34485 RepID=A0ACC2S9G7_9FUNG|nr:hypothetical protein DSO57_1007331 [Entomophthora muscae]